MYAALHCMLTTIYLHLKQATEHVAASKTIESALISCKMLDTLLQQRNERREKKANVLKHFTSGFECCSTFDQSQSILSFNFFFPVKQQLKAFCVRLPAC